MDAQIEWGNAKGALVNDHILGHNLEIHERCTKALIRANRLNNPRFSEPLEHAISLAHGWRPFSNNFHGIRYQHLKGEGLMGGDAQLIHSYQASAFGIMQPGQVIRTGERLTISLWARAQHKPVKIKVGFTQTPRVLDGYAAESIVISSPTYKKYSVTLDCNTNDDNCCFFVVLTEPGMLVIDHIMVSSFGKSTVRNDFLDFIADFKIPDLRFPGGCLSTAYHWRHGIGPYHMRFSGIDPVFKDILSYDFGTDEYLDLCCKSGITPHITVNVGTGTPEEAEEWARYCYTWFCKNGIEPLPMYWQIGNEHYGAHEIGNMSPEAYIDILREYVPRIRAAYAKSRIIAIGNEMGGCCFTPYAPFRQMVMKNASDLFDVIALQTYTTRHLNNQHETPEQMILNDFAAGLETIAKVKNAISDCKTYNKNIKVAITEWSLWLYASHVHPDTPEPMDIRHALFAAFMLNQFISLAPWLELANYYHVRGGGFGLLENKNGRLEGTALGDVYALYQGSLPGNVLPISVKDLKHMTNVKDTVNVTAIKNNENIVLFILNAASTERTIDIGCIHDHLNGVTLHSDDPQWGAWRKREAECNRGKCTLPAFSISKVQMPC